MRRTTVKKPVRPLTSAQRRAALARKGIDVAPSFPNTDLRHLEWAHRDRAEREYEAYERIGYAPRSSPFPSKRARVYFIRASTGAIKIGFAVDPVVRMHSLQTSNPERLELLGSFAGTIAQERALHDRLKASRLHGEWFSPSEEVLSVVDTKLHRRRKSP